MDSLPLPVVDYARLKRVSIKSDGPPPRSPMMIAGMVVCTLGFIFIVKRYRDKQAREQYHTLDTLPTRDTRLFS